MLVDSRGFGREIVDRPQRTGAGDRQRRQRQHGDDGDRLRRQHPAHRRRRARAGDTRSRRRSRRRSRSSRASGTTPSCAARCSSCRASSPTSHDHGGDVDRAVDRAREGDRHDGAGADGADRHACRSSSARRIPYFLISLASAALIILASMVLFGLPMRGNWLALLLALSLFLVGALGTGLLDLDRRRHAAGRVSDGAADLVSADADAVRASSFRSRACRRPCSS